MNDEKLLALAEFLFHYRQLAPDVKAAAKDLIVTDQLNTKSEGAGAALKAAFLREDFGRLLCEASNRYMKFLHEREGSSLTLAKKKRDRKPDPLIAERDSEIVRLRDEGKKGEKQLSYGKIAIRINRWLAEKLGRELEPGEKANYGSVKTAYNRKKMDTN